MTATERKKEHRADGPSQHEDSIEQLLRLPGSTLSLEEIKASADLTWGNGTSTIMYLGGARYEFQVSEDGSMSGQLVLDKDRDWRQELFDLHRILERTRYELLVDAPIQCAETSLAFEIQNNSSSISILRHRKTLKNILDLCENADIQRYIQYQLYFSNSLQELESLLPTFAHHDAYRRGADVIERVDRVIVSVRRHLETSATARDQIHADRLAFVQDVTAKVAHISPVKVCMYLDDGGLGGGVPGQHKLIAHSLRELIPGVVPTIHGHLTAEDVEVFHPSGIENGIIFDANRGSQLLEIEEQGRIHLFEDMDPQRFDRFRVRGDVVLRLTGMPGMTTYPQTDDLYHELTSTYFDGECLRMYLQDPLASTPLDLALFKRAQEAQNFSIDNILMDRSSWLAKLDGPHSESLLKLGATGEWKPTSCVWTWAYFTDPDMFLAEMKVLCAALGKEEFERQGVYLPEGRQVVIFAARSRRLERPVALSEWTDLGITVVSETGEIVRPQSEVRAIPATIVWTSGINNSLVRKFLTDLAGGCSQDSDGARFKFPVYCTGIASFAEATSSNHISLHDNVDGAPGYARPTMEYLWQRASAAMKIPHDQRQDFVLREADSMIMGDSSHLDRYLNLREWANLRAQFNSAAMTYNVAYDIADRIYNFQMAQSEQLKSNQPSS